MPRLRIRLALGLAMCCASAQTTYTLQTLAGSDQSGDGGPAGAALFSHLEGIALDTQGNIYLADADGQRVRRIAPNGIVTTLAGDGHAGFSGDGGPATAARLNTPYGVAADRGGNVYIADLGNRRIRKVSREGVITTLAGGGSVTGSLVDGHAATDAALSAPRNVLTDAAGNIFFSDFGAHRVYQINPAGILLRIAGNGTAGFSGDGGGSLFAQLNSPAGLALDASGTLYIADSGNGRIRKVWRGLITTLGDPGRPGVAPIVPLGTPTGVAVDFDGSLLIADPGGAHVLRVTPLLQITALSQLARDIAVDAAGNVYTCAGAFAYKRSRSGGLTTIAGSGNYAYAGDGGAATAARLNAPTGVTRDPAGNIYIADTGNHRIRKVTMDGWIVTIAGTGAPGGNGDSGAAAFAMLNAPQSVAADGAGNLYVADSGNHRIRRIDPSGTISTIAGSGERGFAGDNGPAVWARLDTPGAIALDTQGTLYIADTGNHVIRRVNGDGIIATVAGNANRGYAGDGDVPLAARLDSPSGVAVDKNGTLYIADSGNRRIRRVSGSSAFGPGLISTFPPADVGIWRSPRGLAADAAGNVFLSDAADQRIFRIEPEGRVTVIAGDGLQGFNGEAAAGLAGRLDTPAGLFVDAAGNILAADSGNGRIRVLTPNVQLEAPPPIGNRVTLVNAASLLPGPVAPGELVSIFGAGLGANPQVLFNGTAAAVLFASATQVNVQTPESLAGAAAEVQVIDGNVLRARITAGVADAVPALFAAADGAGQAVALNEDGTRNAAANPAARGSVIVLFATGAGSSLPLSLTVGGYAAEVQFAGAAAGTPGVLQINARIPAGYAPAGMLTVVLQAGSAVSQPGVVIAVR